MRGRRICQILCWHGGWSALALKELGMWKKGVRSHSFWSKLHWTPMPWFMNILSDHTLTLVHWTRFQTIAFYGLCCMLSEGLILTGVSAWIGWSNPRPLADNQAGTDPRVARLWPHNPTPTPCLANFLHQEQVSARVQILDSSRYFHIFLLFFTPISVVNSLSVQFSPDCMLGVHAPSPVLSWDPLLAAWGGCNAAFLPSQWTINSTTIPPDPSGHQIPNNTGGHFSER